MAKNSLPSQADRMDGWMDRRWHLSADQVEVAATEMEFALMRTFEGFGRWQSECLAGVSNVTATGPENALLHVIRMNDRPKTMRDLTRLLNREDVPNIQYSLRKLIGAGLVVREGAGRSGVTYRVTDEGARVTEDYGLLRRKLLIAAVRTLPGFAERLEEAAATLTVLSGIYEEAARVAATHRR